MLKLRGVETSNRLTLHERWSTVGLIDRKHCDRIVTAIGGVYKFAIGMNADLCSALGLLAREVIGRNGLKRLSRRHCPSLGIVIKLGDC